MDLCKGHRSHGRMAICFSSRNCVSRQIPRLHIDSDWGNPALCRSLKKENLLHWVVPNSYPFDFAWVKAWDFIPWPPSRLPQPSDPELELGILAGYGKLDLSNWILGSDLVKHTANFVPHNLEGFFPQCSETENIFSEDLKKSSMLCKANCICSTFSLELLLLQNVSVW